MSNPSDEVTKLAAEAAPGYHAPVLVDYGDARNMTRTSVNSTVPDGGPADEDSGFLDDGAQGPSSIT